MPSARIHSLKAALLSWVLAEGGCFRAMMENLEKLLKVEKHSIQA